MAEMVRAIHAGHVRDRLPPPARHRRGGIGRIRTPTIADRNTMKTIIPSFTISERGLINESNRRGWNTEIIRDPVAYFAPWKASVKDAGSVFLLRPFGMSRDGYITHTRNCYGGVAGKTFPLGPDHAIPGCMDEVIDQWCDDGVIVYLYCGGIELPTQMAGALTELEAATHHVRSSYGVPDHANVRWVLDNEGEKDHTELTPTDYMVMALRAVGREVLLEPRPRVRQCPRLPLPDTYACLWNRQRAAIADNTNNPIGLSRLVMVGGNKPDPRENLAQLSTPEARIAEARWQHDHALVTVALATAGLTPERWMKEVVK